MWGMAPKRTGLGSPGLYKLGGQEVPFAGQGKVAEWAAVQGAPFATQDKRGEWATGEWHPGEGSMPLGEWQQPLRSKQITQDPFPPWWWCNPGYQGGDSSATQRQQWWMMTKCHPLLQAAVAGSFFIAVAAAEGLPHLQAQEHRHLPKQELNQRGHRAWKWSGSIRK